MKKLLMASAALACFSSTQAVAITPIPDIYPYPGFSLNIIGGGASFPAIAYREVFDCQFHPLGYGTAVDPGPRPINSNCGGGGGFGNQYLPYIWAYYMSTGSGNGKNAFKQNKASIHSAPSTTIPYTSSELPTLAAVHGAGYHYSGSDDIWTSADDAAWRSDSGDGVIDGASPQQKFGNAIQLPGVAGAVAIILNGQDGTGSNLNQNGTLVTGSTSRINLTRQAVCGIFSGHITKWNNAILTASNGGVAPGTGQITVVHRSDGSGTTFLAVNALVEQCRYVTGPNNESDATVVSYAFPWRDSAGACNDLNLPKGANAVQWPDQQTTCALPTPAGSVFTVGAAGGSGALVTKVQGTPGAIGYASTDYTRHVSPSRPITANLQNQFDVSTNTGTPTFVAPTKEATSAAISSITPIFDSATLGNPLAWSLQGVVPNPVLKNAYPIAGFSWILMYQCYASSISPHTQLVQMLASLYSGTSNGQGIIEANGFIQPTNEWQTYIWQLINDASLRPRGVSEGGACSGKAGAL